MQEIKLDSNVFLSGQWPLNDKKTTIIFVHGAGQLFRFWELQLIELSKKNNVIAINLPGRNGFKKLSYVNINNYTKFIIDFMLLIDFYHNIICGLSMGGALAQYLLFKKSKMFNLSIIINSGARLKVSSKIMELVKTNYTKYLNKFIKLSISKKNFKFKVLKDLANSLINNKEVTLVDFMICNNFDFMEKIKYLKTKTLVLTSEEDLLTPKKYGLYLSYNINSSEHVNIKKSGHMTPIERRKKITSLIDKFVKLNVSYE